jgi:hypothetical protein
MTSWLLIIPGAFTVPVASFSQCLGAIEAIRPVLTATCVSPEGKAHKFKCPENMSVWTPKRPCHPLPPTEETK